jgi:hypothetical protein
MVSARYYPEVLSDIAVDRYQSPSLVVALLVPHEFHDRQRPPNVERKNTIDLRHGMCQALTGASDTKHTPRTPQASPKSAGVKGIGPGMSEVSDVSTLQVPLSMASGWDERQTPNCLLPLFSVAWHFLG